MSTKKPLKSALKRPSTPLRSGKKSKESVATTKKSKGKSVSYKRGKRRSEANDEERSKSAMSRMQMWRATLDCLNINNFMPHRTCQVNYYFISY